MFVNEREMRERAEYRYTHEPEFHARVERVVQALEAVVAPARLDASDRSLATLSAACAFAWADEMP